MTLKDVRHLKKCIRENVSEIANNKLNDVADIESLMRFCGGVYNDSNALLKEWKSTQANPKKD